MNDYNIIDKIEWHDGIFLNSQLSCKGGSINLVLSVSIYKENKRKNLNIEFINIDNLTINMDAVELIDNRNAGNISNGYIKKTGGKLKYKFFLYLTDGYLNLTFENIKLSYE
jgi:hypothetical protein